MANITRQFTADPLQFLQSHPVSCSLTGKTGLDVGYLKFESANKWVPFVSMTEAEADEDRASFYLLWWDENAVSTGRLGSRADYFYTGPLTGCMFAVDKNWYWPRVVHVNERLDESHVNPVNMKQGINTALKDSTSILRWTYTPNITVIESHEREEGEQYGIFGWRGTFGWTFVRQIVDIGSWNVVAVEKLDNWF